MSNKSNLTVLSTTLAATGAVVVGAGTTAHADTVKAPVPEQVQTVKAQDQKLDDDINQAQNDVDNAQKNADQTQNAANDAKQTADDSQKKADAAADQANQAQNDLNDAKSDEQAAQDKANSATDDAINQAQNDINDQKKQNDQADQDVEDAQNDVNHAQDNVNDAKSNVNQSQNDANQADDAASKAQDDVNHAQADLDKGNHAQADLDQAEDDLNRAQDNASKAQAGVNQADQAENDAAQKANDAKQHADDTAKAQNDAQHKADAANKAQDDAQKALDDAKSHQGNGQLIKLGNEYVNALKDYNEHQGYNKDSSNPIVQRLIKASIALNEHNKFQSNAADKAIKINGRQDLTPELLSQLSLYAARLIDAMRDEFGSNHVTVTNGGIKFASDIAREYEDDDWDMSVGGHDVPAINRAATENGLADEAKLNMYEDMASAYGSYNLGDWNLTLDDFKEMIFYSLMSFMANGEEWDHANSILGYLSEDSDQYFGVSIDDIILENSQGVPGKARDFHSHFVFVDPTMIRDASKFDITPIKSDVPSQSTIDQLENDLKTKQADANAANQALATAKANHAKAQAALKRR